MLTTAIALSSLLFTDPFDGFEIVDLSHAYGADTLYWPTSPSRFELKELAHGETEGGYFYASNSICTPEHGGTHLDAPIHFFRDRQTTDVISLDRLMGPAVVIDIGRKARLDADYTLQISDLEQHEAQHGTVPKDSIVLLRTGWSERWPDAKAYLGDDQAGDASNLHFPSFGADTARILIEQRRVAVLGIDTASLDNGQSRDFLVHRVAGENNVPGLENLTNLGRLPTTGAYVIALPMKIAGGSGGPTRVVAMVPTHATEEQP